MTPSQLSNELRRIAAGIESSKNPSKELVANALRSVIAKSVQADAQYAAWKEAASACWSAAKEAEKGWAECMSGGRYSEAAECAAEAAKCMADFAKHCEDNEVYKNAMMAEMKEASKHESKPGHE